MSRIGKKPIEIPQEVEIGIDGRIIKVKGSRGELSFSVPSDIKVEKSGGKIITREDKKTKQSPALFGTTRAIIANMIKGVTQGFERKLELQGIGYRAEIQGKDLALNVGFVNTIKVPAPEGIQFSIEKNIITVSGIDKQKVGNIAAKIRAIRKPEPYKGKGIRYVGEQVRKKAGKKAVATAG